MTTHSISPNQSETDIQSLFDRAEPGDIFRFAPGTYRGAFRMSRSGSSEAPIVIEAEQPGSVIITGADIVDGWEPDPEHPGGYRVEIDLSTVPPSPKHGLLAGRCEQVFVDGVAQKQVLNASEMHSGCFRYDGTHLHLLPAFFTGEQRGGTLEIDAGAITGGGTKQVDRSSPKDCWPFLLKDFDPAEHCIEVTTRSEIFATGAGQKQETPAHVHIRGLLFRASGDAPQQPMVRFCGQHLLIEDCLFEQGAARGFDLRCDHSIMRRCVTRLNGQMGFSGYGHYNLVEDCALLHNNTKHDTFVCFEQGGCKIVRATNWIVRRVRCSGNDGPGIWFDIDNYDIVIEQCFCEGNSGPGIMYEISWEADIRNNICINNGYTLHKDHRFDSPWNSTGNEDPIYGQGILVQMSRNTRVYNNTCVGNRRCGIEVRHHPYQQSGNPGHATEDYVVRDNDVFNNLLADNAWDNLLVSLPSLNPAKAHEVLENHHDHNLFHNSTSFKGYQGDLHNYCRWGKIQQGGTMSLEEWRASRHQDLNSIQWDPYFLSAGEHDYRLEPQSPALGRGRPVEGLTVDFYGNPRPDSPAIGACEVATLSSESFLKRP
jgi:hypothetical protein